MAAEAAQASELGEDLELVLAVDTSRSIDDYEHTLQIDGYARALTDPEVLKAVRSGVYGTIRSIDGDHVMLEVAPGIELKIAKRAVAAKVEETDGDGVVDLTDETGVEGSTGPDRPDAAGG